VSFRYLIGSLEIFGLGPGDIWFGSWRYLIVVLEIFIGVLKIFDWCPGDI